MKNCLLIGGNGFIGHHLYSELKDILSVSIYDKEIPTGNPSKEVIEARKIGLPKCISDEDMMNTKWDYVIHLASIAGVRSDIPSEVYFGNNNGDLQTYIRMLQYDKFIYISSSSVLGNSVSPYSLSKEISEAQVKQYCPNYLIIRPFTVYGENGRPDMLITRGLNQDKLQINGKPESILRYYTYVKDLTLCIYRHLNTSGITINAIGSRLYSIKDIINILGVKYKITDSDKRDFTEYKLDNSPKFICETLVEDYVKKIRRGI